MSTIPFDMVHDNIYNFFDTLRFAKRMEDAGLPKKVAEELAEALKETQTQSMEGLATKADIHSLRQELKGDINSLEQKIELKMEILKKDIINKLGTIMVIGVTVLVY